MGTNHNNSVLGIQYVLTGITDRLTNRLRSVINAAARLIYAPRRTEHVTPLLHDLHWLRYPRCYDCTTSPTNSSRVCRRLIRDGIFGRLRRPISPYLAFSGRHSAVVHSLWQRLKLGTVKPVTCHIIFIVGVIQTQFQRLSCSWNSTFELDIG